MQKHSEPWNIWHLIKYNLYIKRFAVLTFGKDFCAMWIRNRLGNGKSDAAAAGLRIAWGIGAVKPVKQAGQIFFFDFKIRFIINGKHLFFIRFFVKNTCKIIKLALERVPKEPHGAAL